MQDPTRSNSALGDRAAVPRRPIALPVRRLLWVPVGVSGVLVVTVLLALVFVSWHGLERMRPVQSQLGRIAGLQDLGLGMERMLIRRQAGEQPLEATAAADLHSALAAASRMPYLSDGTRARLKRIEALLSGDQVHSLGPLSDALTELRAALMAERRQLQSIIDKVAHNTRAELDLALLLLAVLPLVGAVVVVELRRRVGRPLLSLGDLLARLAERDYRPISSETVDEVSALVQPVFRSYNDLVRRLRELEAEHNDRERTLEQEVRCAAEALLTQSRQLARSERLAAVGAVSAGLAHELRNPLAGILMACTKLRRALVDSDQAARLEAVIAELKRLNRLLSERVEAARYAPEPLQPIDLKATVEALFSLLRYQIAPGIRLNHRIPDGLTCLLPEGGLRQALLNLVLNAAQSLDEAQGEIEVLAERTNGKVVLSVCDTGPGFPSEMLALGVRPFASGRSGGTGLGLAMVRRFAEDINAELELANRGSKGARVALHLPCRAQAEAELSRGQGDV